MCQLDLQPDDEAQLLLVRGGGGGEGGEDDQPRLPAPLRHPDFGVVGPELTQVVHMEANQDYLGKVGTGWELGLVLLLQKCSFFFFEPLF